MSMVAIFALDCCGREVVAGRFRGSEMYPPSVAKCPFGCAQRFLPSGKPDRVTLRFQRYASEELVAPALLRTWRWRPQTGDLWHKYNRAWLKRKEALEQGVAR